MKVKAKPNPRKQESRGQFADTPEGQYKRWTAEFAAAKPKVKKWHKDGDKAVRTYLGTSGDGKDGVTEGELEYTLNLFHSNVTTLMAMLYGNTPKVEVNRSFADADDDIGRVAGQMAQRILNQDIQNPGSTCIDVLKQALEDRLLPGMGSARCRYDCTIEETEVPPQIDPVTGQELAEGYTEENKTKEWVDIIYTHWKDILWSPARTYKELRWKAFRSYMDYTELKKRFGEEIADKISLSSKGPFAPSDSDSKETDSQAKPQAEIWEIWSKGDKKVYWFVEGFQKTLDIVEDPLELDQFWPDPPPMIANVTTSRYMPRSDYAIAQDLYIQIDRLETRIALLTEACKCVGVYDQSQEGIKRIFNEGLENDLIPVDNWANFAEKGGLQGTIVWVPLKDVVDTITLLTQKQRDKIQQLYEVTGMSDILRGASQKYEAAATSKAKVEFASIRVQALQDEFARFASDLQSIKLEIMQKHFDDYCFIEQSNIKSTPDADKAEAALALLRDRNQAKWRIKIRPETLALADYAQLKQDRGEYIVGLATFMQSAAPLVQLDKKITPILLKLLQWGLAGFKGSNEIEGVMDQAVAIFTKQAEQPQEDKPDPAVEKMKMEMQLATQEHQQKMQQQQQEFQMKMQEMQQNAQLEREKMQQEIQQDQQKFMLEIKKLMMELQFKERSAKIEQEQAITEQAAQFEFNSAEREHDLATKQASSENQLNTERESSANQLAAQKEQAKIKKPNGEAKKDA